jgi:hypothetical protein
MNCRRADCNKKEESWKNECGTAHDGFHLGSFDLDGILAGIIVNTISLDSS